MIAMVQLATQTHMKMVMVCVIIVLYKGAEMLKDTMVVLDMIKDVAVHKK